MAVSGIPGFLLAMPQIKFLSLNVSVYRDTLKNSLIAFVFARICEAFLAAGRGVVPWNC